MAGDGYVVVGPRRLEVGTGWARAIECPKCLHTKCGPECACECRVAEWPPHIHALVDPSSAELARGVGGGEPPAVAPGDATEHEKGPPRP